MITSTYYSFSPKEQLRIEANYNNLQTFVKSSLNTIYFNRELSIGSLLGFDNRVLKNGEEHYLDKTIEITIINIIATDCNIVGGSYVNSTSAHIQHQFSMNVTPG